MLLILGNAKATQNNAQNTTTFKRIIVCGCAGRPALPDHGWPRLALRWIADRRRPALAVLTTGQFKTPDLLQAFSVYKWRKNRKCPPSRSRSRQLSKWYPLIVPRMLWTDVPNRGYWTVFAHEFNNYHGMSVFCQQL